jgi:competence protein ComEC
MPASRSVLDAGWRIAAAALASLAGIGLQMQQPVLWPAAHYLALGLAAPLLAGLGRTLAPRRQAGVAGLLGLCLATVALLLSAGLQWPASLVLLAAAAVVTLLDPWAVMPPGF